ncbi:MAG: SCO family protein [Planctomycetes bacterium]|nr:SCO family protein [Planctomycetota bacterium]
MISHSSTHPLRRRALRALGGVVLAAALCAPAVHAQGMMGDQNPAPARKTPVDINKVRAAVGFDQKLGGDVPLDVEFRDETGAVVKLGDYFGDKPVILTPVYYGCPMLCTQVLNGLVSSMRALGLEAGKDFQIVSYTINPAEGPELAVEKKAKYLHSLGKPEAGVGWHFLSALPLPKGEQLLAENGEALGPGSESIHRLADSIGFRYWYDRELGHYAHEPGIVVLTPKGRISKYLFGIEFDARTLKFALIEASSGKVGTVVDQLLMLCFHYDPTTGKYGLVLTTVLQITGGAFLVVLVGFIVLQVRRDHRKARLQAGAA